MSDIPQRLANDLQRARQDLQQERARTQQLLAELERQNAELDRLRSSVHRESNSRLLAEEALGETRDRLELAVDAAELALWEWQLPSTQVFLTARWGEMLGDVALEGYWDITTLMDRVHPEDRDGVQAALRSLRKENKERAHAQFRVRSAGEWLWIESHAMVAERDALGQPLRLMGTHADINERKGIEADSLRARELAEDASRAKSEFLANMSHEVRTPLNALMGLSRLLSDSPLNAEQKSWLDLMNTSADALLALLNDVLDLSKIEAGKLEIESVPFDLHKTLKDVGALYSEQARAKPLSFDLELAPDLPQQVQGDPGRLRQVLGNLLSNALKFTPRNGRIVVTAGVDETHAPNQLYFQVTDSGVGISAKQQRTIFDAFTQADASTARRYGGSGLGLAICSRLVKLMGGGIELHSALGQGSRFVVTLPLPAAEDPAVDTKGDRHDTHALQQTAERFGGLHVLVAEDHPVNELLTNQLLQRLGCTVLNARDGEQAVQLWSQGGVDLLLMDVQMPGFSGLQATRRIREMEADRGSPRTPIVAVTANAMNGDRDACLAAGMDAYVSKPVDPGALFRAMEEAMLRSTSPTTKESLVRATPPAALDSPSADRALDVVKLLRRLDGDDNTLHALAQAMRSDLVHRLHELERALSQNDVDRAISHAHGLTGSLGSMTAARGARLSKGLEVAARAKDWKLFQRVLLLMQQEAQQLDAELAALISAPPSGA